MASKWAIPIGVGIVKACPIDSNSVRKLVHFSESRVNEYRPKTTNRLFMMHVMGDNEQ